MELNEIVSIISQVGFPIFVAVYLMWRMETTLNELKQVIEKNNFILEIIFQFVKEVKKDDGDTQRT